MYLTFIIMYIISLLIKLKLMLIISNAFIRIVLKRLEFGGATTHIKFKKIT
jgi:hypothetical protein